MEVCEKFTFEFEAVDMSKDVCAVIVAGGSSSRMGGLNKLFCDICGIPVIARTLINYNLCSAVGSIVVAARGSDIDEIQKLCETYSIGKLSAIVEGGPTRAQSVANAVAAVPQNTKYIAIADGARPLTSPALIERVVDEAMRFSAAAAAVRVTDTVKVVDESDFITATPERASLRAAQTPQVFERQLYARALAEFGGDCTDDCALVEKTGTRVKLVEGDYSNIKITTPIDLTVARALIEEGRI